MVSQLVNSAVKLIHLRLKTPYRISRGPVMVRYPQQQAHRVARKIREAVRSSDY
jgi:hypothetical protein